MAAAAINLFGGFGNQLFMIAFIYSYSKKNKTHFCFPDIKNPHAGSSTSHIIERLKHDESYTETSKITSTIYEIENTYIEFEKIKEDTLFKHFFQHPKYFVEYRDELLVLFSEPNFIKPKLFEYRDLTSSSMFIHVRLGDYLFEGHSFLNLDLTNYLKTCLNKTSCEKYLLFTDSPTLIFKKYPFLQQPNIILINEKDPLISFYLMRDCYLGGICSNSTFSWMASWLNQNNDKKVFMTKTWFKNRIVDISYPGVELVEL